MIMPFFKNKEKKLAFDNSYSDLKQGYERTEKQLLQVAKTGNDKALKKAMSEHHNYEYAMLFRNTPEFKNKCK